MKAKEHVENINKSSQRNTKEAQTNEGKGKLRKHKQMKPKEHKGNIIKRRERNTKETQANEGKETQGNTNK